MSTAEVTARFWPKVNKTETCWLWIGANSNGYGYMRFGGKMRSAHRISWLIAHGSFPPSGLELDHLCRVRNCVNPTHLEPVSTRENARRGVAGLLNGARQRAKTTCPRGHAYSPENTRTYRSWRKCKQCEYERDQGRRR